MLTGTSGGAESVGGAGVEGHVGKIAVDARVEWRVAVGLLQAGHLAADDNALTRREGQFAAGALRLAVSALDALVDLGLDRGQLLEVGEVGALIGVDDDAGIQQIVGIGQLLQPPHDLIAVVAPLGLDERGHVATGAMLGLEGAVVTIDHKLHHIVDEVRILIDGGLRVEALGDDEVEIAVLGVAEDDGVVVAVQREELVQAVGGVGERFDREGHVFDDDGGAALAH